MNLRLIFGLLILSCLTSAAFAGKRRDVDVDLNQWAAVPMAGDMVKLAIHDRGTKIDLILVYTTLTFTKSTGFDTDDTNRTLIYTHGADKLYYVNTPGVSPGKARLAVISE